MYGYALSVISTHPIVNHFGLWRVFHCGLTVAMHSVVGVQPHHPCIIIYNPVIVRSWHLSQHPIWMVWHLVKTRMTPFAIDLTPQNRAGRSDKPWSHLSFLPPTDRLGLLTGISTCHLLLFLNGAPTLHTHLIDLVGDVCASVEDEYGISHKRQTPHFHRKIFAPLCC